MLKYRRPILPKLMLSPTHTQTIYIYLFIIIEYIAGRIEVSALCKRETYNLSETKPNPILFPPSPNKNGRFIRLRSRNMFCTRYQKEIGSSPSKPLSNSTVLNVNKSNENSDKQHETKVRKRKHSSVENNNNCATTKKACKKNISAKKSPLLKKSKVVFDKKKNVQKPKLKTVIRRGKQITLSKKAAEMCAKRVKLSVKLSHNAVARKKKAIAGRQKSKTVISKATKKKDTSKTTNKKIKNGVLSATEMTPCHVHVHDISTLTKNSDSILTSKITGTCVYKDTIPGHVCEKEIGHSELIRTGDIIWGKVNGCPWWPGRIDKIDRRQQNCQKMATISWYASRTTSVMPCRAVCNFMDHYNIRYSKRKKGNYQRAVILAKQAACERNPVFKTVTAKKIMVKEIKGNVVEELNNDNQINIEKKHSTNEDKQIRSDDVKKNDDDDDNKSTSSL